MKKFLLFVPVLFIAIGSFSQTLSQVSFSNATTLSYFAFAADQQAVIRVSQDGNLIEWGIAPEPGRIGYYDGKLQPFMGKVDYYGQEADVSIRGKVRSLGTCIITYYTSSFPDEQKGKIKSIGIVGLDYYMNYDNASLKGKLKTAGGTAINYYSSFDNEAFKGKLKSVGNTTISYYSAFDDNYNKGKIKTIGTANFVWYGDFDNNQYKGGLKSGNSPQKINGITYNIWF